MSAETRDRCASCHADHRGRGFAMINWGPGGRRSFDHRSAGWPLVGKHATTRCETCHDNRRIVTPAIARAARSQPEAHDLPRAAIAVRQLSLRRAPRPARAGLPALPQRRGRDLRGPPDRSITPAPTFRCAGNTSRWPAPTCHPQVADGAAPTGFPQASGGHVRAVQADRARHLRELPPRSPSGGLRQQLRRLPQRKRLGRRQPVAGGSEKTSTTRPGFR